MDSLIHNVIPYQDGSIADTAGLLVGDMILSVNGEDFVGASYETAAKVGFCLW